MSECGSPLAQRLRFMPRPYPSEFRFRAATLVRAGKPITTAVYELGLSAAALHTWVRQDQVDRGERSGITRTESAQLTKANKRIRLLEIEVEILRTAAALFRENCSAPEEFTRYSTCSSTPEPVKGCCRLWCQQPRLLRLQDPADVIRHGFAGSGSRADRRTPHSLATALRVLICVYGAHARYDIVVSENLVGELMRFGVAGLPGPAKDQRLKGVATAEDLVHRQFHRIEPNELWVNVITELLTRKNCTVAR